MLRRMAVYSFAIEVMVRGYHVYQSIWDAAIDGKYLECFREVGNIHFLRYAASVKILQQSCHYDNTW